MCNSLPHLHQSFRDLTDVVIVDDEPSLTKVLQEFFVKIFNYPLKNVKLADTGKKAFDLFLDSRLAQSDKLILITDLRMPEMDGFQLIKKLKEHFSEKFTSWVIYLVTGVSMTDEQLRTAKRIEELGVKLFFKPISYKKVIEKAEGDMAARFHT